MHWSDGVAALVWGLVGGIGYAGTRLSTALWGGEEITSRARSLAIAQFGVAVMLAPAAAYAFTPMLQGVYSSAPVPATSFLTGLLFNAVWPLLVEPKFVRQLVADMARGLASRLGGEQR